MSSSTGRGPAAGPAVRAGAPADLEAVVALERDGLGRDAWSAGLLAAGLAGTLPTVSYLVAEQDGAVLGHAVASCAGDVVELQRIAVHGEHRRRGIGDRLLRAVLDLAGPGERVLLEVREDNVAARAFYARAGFVELARRPRYFADGATALVLESVRR